MKTYYYIGHVYTDATTREMALQSAELDEKKVESKGDYERVRVPARDLFGVTHRMIRRRDLYDDQLTVLRLIADAAANEVTRLEIELASAREQADAAQRKLLSAFKHQTTMDAFKERGFTDTLDRLRIQEEEQSNG